ncbi:exosome complex component rrp46 [Arabis alpina]|uniref:Exosome complex exonuclease RRP46 homolog n=1 Tax=Arabis alpina TaxID=50452 RepID=A0A087GVR7_ARAAL|nr:exosome complex component rrp46 [Arabis alpina]
MEIDREDGRTPNQLRPLACSRNILHRPHGSASWSQGDTKVLAAVYGPKAGTKRNEDPEKACFEVIWKPKSGQIGKVEKEYEMILKKTIQSICVLTVNPNTTTSVIIQLLPCAINAACAALVDAGIPMKHLAVAICCCLADKGYVVLDPNKLEEKTYLNYDGQKMTAFAYLVFPNTTLSVLPKGSSVVEGEPVEHGIITSVTHGVMSVDDYFLCVENGRAATASLSAFFRKNFQQSQKNSSIAV